MKTIALLIGLSVAGSSMAQEVSKKEPRSPIEKSEHMTSKMSEKLALSPEQITKVSAINLEHATKLQNIKASTNLSDAEMHTKLKECKKDLMAAYKPVLTPEQMKTLKDMKEKHHEIRKAKKAEAKPATDMK